MYDPNHHRHSIRLKGYDYSQSGAYFVTICCQNRAHLFGFIQNGVMQLNDAGKMVQKWYDELAQKFPNIQCGEMVVMPNHIHFIVVIVSNISNEQKIHEIVGADLRVCPNSTGESPISNEQKIRDENHILGEHTILGEHIGSPLQTVVQWFKTMTTNEYIRGVKSRNWQPFNKRIWQRNYWEHIIRDEQSHKTIAEYIVNNPHYWETDKFYE